MCFSPLYEYSGKACMLSPDGNHTLFSYEKQIIIIENDTQTSVVKLFCSDRVDSAEWSPNSKLVFGIVRRSKSMEVGTEEGLTWKVFSIEDLSWNVTMQDEKNSITSALWVPNSRFILTSSEYNLLTCVWSLSSRIV